MEENVTPENEVMTILERLRDGGLWQPAGLGLSYVKEEDKHVKLIEQENNPMSAQARIRMRMLIESVGWSVDESEVHVIDTKDISPQERHMQEMMMRQEIAQSWKCNCGTSLAVFELEKGVWTFDGQQEMTLPDGGTETVEQWSVVVECPVCDAKIPMEPYDYGLLAGDEAMLTYRTKKLNYIALERIDIIRKIDSNEHDIVVLGTFCPFHGDMLPPHVRGSVVTWETLEEEEE